MSCVTLAVAPTIRLIGRRETEPEEAPLASKGSEVWRPGATALAADYIQGRSSAPGSLIFHVPPNAEHLRCFPHRPQAFSANPIS